ncbi:MAG TPA: cation:proton antiporter [Candidatus Binatia bacterium]|nr:cation:proton antiporter [Candidatus Binatia bacterium]
MGESLFLQELIVVLAATIGIVFFFQKLSLPTIAGFLLAGVIIGPNGLGLIKDAGTVDVLAEVGVQLLLFTIGLEFSLSQLLSLQKRIIGVGLLQVGLTILAVVGIASLAGVALKTATFYGFLVALSSTAIVLRVYRERNELNSIQGKLTTTILLLQDLSIVPMILLVPLLGASGSDTFADIALAISKALLALAAIIWTARTLLPRMLHQVALLRNREVFLLFIVFVCLGTAWLTSLAGLSLALGALIAGMVISESELSHQIVADVLPLRHTFSGIFFISIGMLLDLELLLQHLAPSISLLVGLISVKSLVVLLLSWWFYKSIRLGVILALSLAQVGEFSFILAKLGIEYQLLAPAEKQIFLAASIMSMIATPFMIQFAQPLAFWILGRSRRKRQSRAAEPLAEDRRALANHVIIVGYGLNGQNLARVLKEVGIPFCILEMNPDLIHEAGRRGETVSFGDGSRPEILEQAGIQDARVLVIAISDSTATAQIVSIARRMRSDLTIIVRTRYVAELDSLYRLGANEVIPEEFETSVEIFARVLQQFHVPHNVIALQVDLIRRAHYGTLRGIHLQGRGLDELNRFLVGATSDLFSILEGSPAAAKSLEELDLPGRSGVSLVAVIRDERSFVNLQPEFKVEVGDKLVLIGAHKALDAAAKLLNPAGSD